MTGRQLLRLYPAAWRERYGDEFLEVAGDEPLDLQGVIDVVSGAIDARLSGRVRPAGVAVKGQTGGVMLRVLKNGCRTNGLRMSIRDSLLAGGIIIGVTLLAVAVSFQLREAGHGVVAETIMGLAMPFSLTATFPLTFMKGQPWRAQVVIVGGTLAMLTLIGYLTVLWA